MHHRQALMQGFVTYATASRSHVTCQYGQHDTSVQRWSVSKVQQCACVSPPLEVLCDRTVVLNETVQPIIRIIYRAQPQRLRFPKSSVQTY